MFILYRGLEAKNKI